MDFSTITPGFKAKRSTIDAWMFGQNIMELIAYPSTKKKGGTNYKFAVSGGMCEHLGVSDDSNILTIWDKEEGLFIGNVTTIALTKSEQMIMSKTQKTKDYNGARFCRNKNISEGFATAHSVGFYTVGPLLDGQTINVAPLTFIGATMEEVDAWILAQPATLEPEATIAVAENEVTDLTQNAPGLQNTVTTNPKVGDEPAHIDGATGDEAEKIVHETQTPTTGTGLDW